uniref:Mannose-P-dolichol utilization defect 1 protein homolog n=1 Tax=Parascaris univalens TaxID=6257 RepID=A0A915CG25_PARUN
MATELYHLVDEALRFVFPKNCFEEMLIKLNIFHPECSSLVLSRVLGLAITGGSLMLFIPQIIKIHVARSGAGISLSSQLLGLLSCFATAAYSYTSNFVFSQWGDSLFVAIQMAIIIMQILYYSALSAYAFAFLAFCWAVIFAVIGKYIPFAILAAFQAVTIPLVVASKFLQIRASYRDGSTGQLSLISVALQFGGCLARVYTSVKETGDALVIVMYVAAVVMNGIILGQIFWYWNADKKKDKKRA